MSNQLEKKLYRAAALTFEELGYMLPTPELDELQTSAHPDIAVSVQFDGDLSGRLVMSICSSLLPLLASNMLGESGVPSLEQQHDGLKEIANVICGNVLPGITDSNSVCHIGSPQLVEGTEPTELVGVKPTTEICFGLNEGRADLRLYLEAEKPLPGREERLS